MLARKAIGSLGVRCGRWTRGRVVVGAAVEALERRQLLTAYTVTTTADSGAGSLRQAILDANAHGGADQVVFAIPGGGVQVIRPVSALPAITDPLVVDGTTQAGYSSAAGTPVVEIDGGLVAGAVPGIEVAAGQTTIKALAIHGFNGAGVQIDANADGAVITLNSIGTDVSGMVDNGNLDGVDVLGPNATVSQNLISGNDNDAVAVSQANGAKVTGNWIGVDESGAGVLPNQGDGVSLYYADNATVSGNVIAGSGGNGVAVFQSAGAKVTGNLIGMDVTGKLAVSTGGDSFGNHGDGVSLSTGAKGAKVGGPGAADRNVIANGSANGVRVASGAAADNVVQGNFLGTDVTGTVAMGNQGDGVLTQAPGLSVTGNLISGNVTDGVAVLGGAAVIQGNNIGTAADGVSPLGNGVDGVYVTSGGSTIGGTGANAGNVVAFNGINGVTVVSGNGNLISRNSIYSNGDIGIDLGGDGVTPNDAAGHGDANLRENFPVLTSAQQTGTGVTVQGTINAAASTNYTIELFGNVSPDPTGYGEGQTYLGTVQVKTGASGRGTFTANLTGVPAGETYVAATATDPAGNTSEFGQDVQIATAPPPVVPIPTVTTLASSLNPSHFGQSVTFTAHVTAATGNPTGAVTFKEGSVVLGTATLDAADNARISTSTLTVGDHTIVAYYGGSAAYLPSQSPPLVQHVLVSPATAGGRVLQDVTGNGLSGDDVALPGVTVDLFLDRNNNGVLDTGDGARVASTTSAADGKYSFSGLSPFGRYFIQEEVPAAYVRTAPATSSYYVVNTGDGTASGGNDFDNYQTCDCSSALQNVKYTINGYKTVYDLRGNVHEGDTVKVTFAVPYGKKMTLSLVSYAAPDSYFDSTDASRQKVFKSATGTFGAGVHTLTVTVPKCYFQIDFVCGKLIDKLGPAGSNIFYTAEKRLISADNGGVHAPITSMLYS